MRTTNPALSTRVLRNVQRDCSGETMTIQGTINKTGLLLLVVFLSGSWVWRGFFTGSVNVKMWMMIGIFGGLIAALCTIFKKEWAPITAPLYALLEGFALGGISAIFQKMYPGIVFQAILLTFGTLFCMLAGYKTGVIRVTEKFKAGVMAATGAIALFYLITFIFSLFGVRLPIFYGNGFFSIALSAFVVVIAALNLVLDFDFIEQGSRMGVAKYMEWYGAFGIMVTLIWLYIEILRLLSKLQSRR
ncbi:Bax inhibitor-1/YccA family protein [Chlamydiota bacterium]